MLRAFGISSLASGAEVTPTTALGWTALMAGIRVLSETIASLPLKLYEHLEPRGKRLREDHPLFSVLHHVPNPEMTSVEWRDVSMAHVLLWGNAYSEIVRDGRGRIRELWPLNPDRVRVERDPVTRELIYRVTLPVTASEPLTLVRLQAHEVFHLRGFSLTGVLGLSPIWTHREAIGLGLVTELFAARFFGNGASPGGVLQHPGKLSEEAIKRLRAQWEEVHGGVSRAHRVAILEEGMQWKDVVVVPEKAQFLGLREFQVTEAARILRVPPHKLADLSRATFSNIEHQAIEFVVDSLRPWLVRWEQRIQHSLLSPQEPRIFAEFLVDGLLRGDIQARFQSYAVARQWGWMSANDIREKENQNPVEGGDLYLTPLNMVPTVDHRHAGVARARLIIEAAAQRLLRKELDRVRAKAVKLADDPVAWRAWVEEFYAAEWPDVIAEHLQLEPGCARRYTETRRMALLTQGIGIVEQWEQASASALIALALKEDHDDAIA